MPHFACRLALVGCLALPVPLLALPADHPDPKPAAADSDAPEEADGFRMQGGRMTPTSQGVPSTLVVGSFYADDNLLGRNTHAGGGEGTGRMFNGGEVDC